MEIDGSWMLLRSGKYFSLANPTEDMVDIQDIAHALAHLSRFGGHTQRFYSVAEHSVHVSHLVEKKNALAGLLHDAPEYVLGDVISPLKCILSEYRDLEKRVSPVILGKYGVTFPMCADVQHADLSMLLAEQRQVMLNDDNWGLPDWIKPAQRNILCLSPAAARAQFLMRFEELTGSLEG